MIKRALHLFLTKSKKSILLLGPRQTGKSTLIKSLKPDLSINLSNEREYLRFSSDPGLLESILRANSYQTIFIDEIQRIPSLLNTIQDLIDNFEGRKLRFFLTGSSARKLRRGNANLLPGRVLSYSLGGLSSAELNHSLDLKKALKFGCLPEPYLSDDSKENEQLLYSYAAIYLKEEIQAEALTKNLEGFSRFLSTVSRFANQVVDYTKISKQSHVSRTSIIRFMEILEDTLVAERIFVFKDDESIDVIRHPKVYFFDGGVLNGLLENFTVSQDRIGPLFENLVYSQIRNTALGLNQKCEIYFFRTRGGLEIDFILRLNEKIYAVEVKSGHCSSEDLTKLAHFKKYYPATAGLYLISLKETEKRRLNGVTILGLNEFLREIF